MAKPGKKEDSASEVPAMGELGADKTVGGFHAASGLAVGAGYSSCWPVSPAFSKYFLNSAFFSRRDRTSSSAPGM